MGRGSRGAHCRDGEARQAAQPALAAGVQRGPHLALPLQVHEPQILPLVTQAGAVDRGIVLQLVPTASVDAACRCCLSEALSSSDDSAWRFVCFRHLG